jgi:acetyltransferase-like isoleucine patch superfamily enzyme
MTNQAAEIGKNVDIDETVQLGTGVILRDNVNLRYVVVGDGVKIGRNTIIFGTESKPVHIGKNSYISPNCYFNGAAGLEIENEVTIAANVMIFSDSGPNVGPLKKYYPTSAKSIKLGAGCWIGAACILLPGAEMSSESILAANSTLTTKVGFHEIYGGNLAKLIKKIDVQE